MSDALAYTILGAIVVSGGVFLFGALGLGSNADDASEDLSDRIAHGDIIRLPPTSSFHDQGVSR